MAKTRISSTDLAWIFQEKLNAFDSCPPAVSIAIVPTGEGGWGAVTTARVRAAYPLCARRIEQIQKQLRGIYVLAKGLNISRQKMRGAPPNGLWELQN
jgi:hypothetical protein